MKRFLGGFMAVALIVGPGGSGDLGAAARKKKKAEAAPAALAEITGVSLEENRIKISLNRSVPYRTYVLENPPRLVAEFSGATDKSPASLQEFQGDDLVRKIEVSGFVEDENYTARVVTLLKEAVDYQAAVSGNDVEITLIENPETTEATSKRWDLLGNLPEDRIDLDFESEEVRNTLKLLGDLSGINIIYGADVGGTFTVHLRQVPFREAFSTVLAMNNLVARQLGDNVLWVMSPATLTQNRANAPMETRTLTLNYAKADQVKSVLDQMRTTAGRKGVTATDPRTNTVTIMDTSEGLDEGERILALLDKKPIQIMIEARIIEVQLDNSLDLGIQWEIAHGRSRGNSNYGIGTTELAEAPGAKSLEKSGTTKGVVTGSPGNFVNPVAIGGGRASGVSFPASIGAAAGSAITFGFVNDTSALLATLSALATKNKTNILSAPKIVTLNSEQAKIEAVSQIPFAVATVSPGVGTTQSFQLVSAGITLTVTPTANPSSRIMLKLKPEISIPVAGFNAEIGPTLNTRTAETSVVVNDGQTIVVGGLISETDTKAISKVPLLGDIPILGPFFRRSLDQKNRTELLVLVTPRIIKD